MFQFVASIGLSRTNIATDFFSIIDGRYCRIFCLSITRFK